MCLLFITTVTLYKDITQDEKLKYKQNKKPQTIAKPFFLLCLLTSNTKIEPSEHILGE